MKNKLLSYTKALLLVAAMAVGSATALAEDSIGVIVVKADGSSYELALPAVDRIAFGPTAVEVVSEAGQSTSFAYADVDRIMLGAPLSGISEITSRGDIAVWPTMVQNTVSIAGAAPGTEVRVYTLGGALIATGRCGDETLSLDLSSAPAGVCLVAVGNHTVKIIKK